MSVFESHEGRLVPSTTGGPISDPQRPHSPVSGVDSADAWSEERLEADLRRVLKAIDGMPPPVNVRPDPGLHAHDIADTVLGCRECVAKEAAEVRRDFEQFGCEVYPEGDSHHDYRITASSFYGTGRDHADWRDGQTTYRCRRCGDVFVALDSEMEALDEERWADD